MSEQSLSYIFAYVSNHPVDFPSTELCVHEKGIGVSQKAYLQLHTCLCLRILPVLSGFQKSQ